ncbi:hypothetical protein SPTER_09050 [Sporomusa termitida]|uniref:Uncharacterized protein n=1 Tax=Sporomusa termitida TaxID=2377 RepID=A0A517DQM6_9FIRM|nr:hypothetical protein SPTER_09050 [Sporomusa termitida]
MTLHKLRKALMQGRFFYVGRLSLFAFWRINGSAPRHSILNLMTPILTSNSSNCKHEKQNATVLRKDLINFTLWGKPNWG